MIVYKDILRKLSAAGWTSYRLRNEKMLSEETMQRIRTGGILKTDSLDKICRLLNCPIEEIICYVPDEEQGG